LIILIYFLNTNIVNTHKTIEQEVDHMPRAIYIAPHSGRKAKSMDIKKGAGFISQRLNILFAL